MVANSLPEIYTLVYGWFIFERIWDVLVTSGLFWIPFIIAIIRISVETRNAGSYAGNIGVLTLQRIETQVVAMLFVILFACMPFKHSGFNLSISTVNYQSNINECRPNTDVKIPDQVRDAFAEVEGEMVYIPIFWGVVHSISSAAINAMTVALPCKNNIAFGMFQLSESHIQDPVLRKDITLFHDQCYQEAKTRLQKENINPDPNDTDWLGSLFFMDTPGYYNDIRFGPLDGWAHDDRFTNHSDPDLVYRSCSDYWLDGSIGLENRVIETVDPGLVSGYMEDLYIFFGANDTVREKRRSLAQSILSTSIIKANELSKSFRGESKYNLTSSSDQPWLVQRVTESLDAVAGAVAVTGRGLLLTGKNIASHSEKFIYRESANYILAIAQMILIITIPIILLLSGFSLKALAMCGVGYFAVKFVNFIWAFGFWLETTWMTALRSDSGFDVNQQLLLNIISNTVYIGLPMAWLVILGWSGFQINGLMSNLDSDSRNTSSQIGTGMGNIANPVNYVGGGKAAIAKAALGKGGGGGGGGALPSGSSNSSQTSQSSPRYY